MSKSISPSPAFRRVNMITPEEFWGTMRVLKTQPVAEHLATAIEAGKAGKQAAAWRALAAYHRESLAGEYEYLLEQTFQQELANRTKLDAMYENRINVWHTLLIDFGKTIDWNTRHLGKPLPGFHYVFWLLPAVRDMYQGNEAARAWIEKTIVAYHKALPDMIDPTATKNPGAGIVNGRLPCMGKIRAFMPAYLWLIRQPDVKPSVIAAFNLMFLGMARAMQIQMTSEAKLAGMEPNGNISIAGTSVLFRYGVLFPEFRESAAWRKRGIERYRYFAKSSFYADGGYCERVWGYGVGALSHLVDGYVTARRYGGFGEHDEEIRTALHRCFTWYAKTLGPGERQPTFGDGESTPTKVRRAMDLAAEMFPESTDRYLGVDRTASYLLQPSEFVVMRNGDDANSVYMNLSFGQYTHWHEHFDQLSLNLWAHDGPVLEELDRWGPYHNPLDILVRAPEAHNLFLVDGMVYDNRHARGHDVHFQTDASVDFFTACHRAYRFEVYGIKGPGCFNMNGVVRRTVVFVKDPGYALVMDSVFDENHDGFNRAVSQYWHGPNAFRVKGDGIVQTKGCVLAFARTERLRRLHCTVDFAGDEVDGTGPYRERYSLRARRWGQVEEPGQPGMATLLYPHKGRAPQVSITALPSENGEAFRADGFEIVTPHGTDRIYLNPENRPDLVVDGVRVDGRGLVVLAGDRGTIRWG